jgi:biotin carboxyl carrier protein
MSFALRTKDGRAVSVEARRRDPLWSLDDGIAPRDVELLEHDRERITFILGGRVHRAYVRVTGREVRVVLDGRETVFSRQAPAAAAPAGHAAEAYEPVLRSPVPGRVLRVCVEAGAAVQAGDVLVVVEAMKMETPLVAPADGTVSEVHVTAGDLVDQDQELVTCSYEPSASG